jgi:DNA-binding response OmpR family regulator/EAL domain-containing protein (putative c-di-GMP-specific phosphodiesterase class I)
MLRERIEHLLTEWRKAMEGPFKTETIGPIVAQLSDLSAAAGRFQIEAPALVTRDAAAYLGFLLDTADMPNIVQHGRIVNYLERLTQISSDLANLLAREELDRPAVLYVRAAGHEVPGLEDAMRQQGWRPLRADGISTVITVVKGHPLVAVVVDAGMLDQLGEIVTALDQYRKPGPTPPLLVVTRESALSQQLIGMTGSADAFMPNADAAGVIRKLGDLQRSLSSAEPLRVLIVDDDRTQVIFCDAVLRRRGLTTQVANSSREALELVHSFRPDLILVDLYMPEIDGMALTARVREMPGTLLLPIVFISGEQDIGKRVTAINIGADDFLTKPVRPAHLIDVVVGRAKRARALRRQVLGSPAEATTGPLARSVLALRIRDLGDRPAALISLGLAQSDTLSPKLPSLLRCEIEQAVAGRIAARLAPGDAFGPWHDLHFLILAARPDVAALQQLAQSLKHGIDVRPLVISRGQIKVNAQVQLTHALGDPQAWIDACLDTWSHRTDTAPAKAGPTRVTQTTTTPVEAFESSPMMRAVLHPEAALCVTEYQPLIPMRGAAVEQWQQRLRLRPTPTQPARVLRDEVVTAARHGGTLATLDRLALRFAVDTIAAQAQRGHRLRVQFEIDVATLIDPGFVSHLEGEYQAEAREHGGLTLELETDAVIARLVQVRPVLERLRKLGVLTCLRHFGQQRDALKVMQQINAFAVKIDTEMALQPSPAFTHLLAQVRDCGVPIQVEDVPNRAAIAKLWDLGADYMQCELLHPYGQEMEFDFQASVA